MAISGTSSINVVSNQTLAAAMLTYNPTTSKFVPWSANTISAITGYSEPRPSTTISNFAVSGALSGIILPVNNNRKSFTVQNLNNERLYVKFGGNVTESSFTQILKAGSAVDDGNGGLLTSDIWKGTVTASGVTSARYIVYELT